MEVTPKNTYYGDLVVTTMFNIDHANYVGRHIRNMKIGSFILFLLTLSAVAPMFYTQQVIGFAAPIAMGTLCWLVFNEWKRNRLTKDLEEEPLEVEGEVKKDGHLMKLFDMYPGAYVYLKDIKDLFRTDATFLRRIQKGQKVRLLYTPKLRIVKAWQVIHS